MQWIAVEQLLQASQAAVVNTVLSGDFVAVGEYPRILSDPAKKGLSWCTAK